MFSKTQKNPRMPDGVLNVTHPIKGKINYFCLYRSMRNQLEYNKGA